MAKDIIKDWLKNPWKLVFPGFFLTAGVFLGVTYLFSNSSLHKAIFGEQQQAKANFSSVNPYYRGN